MTVDLQISWAWIHESRWFSVILVGMDLRRGSTRPDPRRRDPQWPDPQRQFHEAHDGQIHEVRSTVSRLGREVEVDRLGRCRAAREAKPANHVRASCELDMSKLGQPIRLEPRANKHSYILCRHIYIVWSQFFQSRTRTLGACWKSYVRVSRSYWTRTESLVEVEMAFFGVVVIWIS